MARERLPLIRGRILGEERFVQVRGGNGDRTVPTREPRAHREKLVAQLDGIVAASRDREAHRVEGADREIVAVVPGEGVVLEEDPLASKAHDAQVISKDPETGVVLLDVADPELKYLRKKLDQFATLKTDKGKPRNEPALAPIDSIQLADEADLGGRRYRDAELDEEDSRWFELACRGGSRRSEDVNTKTRAEMARALERLGHGEPREFLASERLWMLVRLTVGQLRQLVASVDCVFEFDLARLAIRDLVLHDAQPLAEIEECDVAEPNEDAPAVVVLDTGVATGHPLLEPMLLSSGSVSPDSGSPEDAHGHGTLMAGVCAYRDLGEALEHGQYVGEHWLQSMKIVHEPGEGAAGEGMGHFWPAITQDGVLGAEEADNEDRNRAFVLAIGGEMDDPLVGTSWSAGLDQLAFNNGDGRLICVAAGNADASQQAFLDGYPQLNLQRKIQDPAQASNVLTVGAYTEHDVIPDGGFYKELEPVAPVGGISPHTTTGELSEQIKPEVVFEGGNVATDGALPNTELATLCTLTTGREFLTSPLALHSMTSCAVANAGRFAATLWSVNPELWPETVRALIVHSASWTKSMMHQFENKKERLAACGFGVPNLGWATECLEDRATVIVEDTMPNAVLKKVKKKEKPKRATTSPYTTKAVRNVKYFHMPLPDEELLELGDDEVELRVTLSYFAEPNLVRGRVHRGMDLQWDMQRVGESEAEFRRRINKLLRVESDKDREWAGKYSWTIGPNHRGKGTVVSDRWIGPAEELAGGKTIAVYPVLGWWDQRERLKAAETPFALVVSLRARGIDIYTPIKQTIEIEIET